MKNHHAILVVDDDLEDQMILEEYFKDFNLHKHVKFIQSGQEGIDYLHSITDNRLLPKLIVLDLNMPVFSGVQTLLAIKRNERYVNIPVIIFSTSENEIEKKKCLSMGAHDYLVKPSSYEEGLRMVEKFSSYVGKL